MWLNVPMPPDEHAQFREQDYIEYPCFLPLAFDLVLQIVDKYLPPAPNNPIVKYHEVPSKRPPAREEPSGSIAA